MVTERCKLQLQGFRVHLGCCCVLRFPGERGGIAVEHKHTAAVCSVLFLHYASGRLPVHREHNQGQKTCPYHASDLMCMQMPSLLLCLPTWMELSSYWLFPLPDLTCQGWLTVHLTFHYSYLNNVHLGQLENVPLFFLMSDCQYSKSVFRRKCLNGDGTFSCCCAFSYII